MASRKKNRSNRKTVPAADSSNRKQQFAIGRRDPHSVIDLAEKEFSSFIEVHGARQHNLKNVDVRIPRDRMVVITGLSGSGKSSLAFDTLYAEGQRRYVESLSAYARQFLGQMDKPD